MVHQSRRQRLVAALLDRQGRTFCADAGIDLADKPAPLYQLLVLSTLLSARISARIATDAAAELFAAGYRTPATMRAAGWQDRVDALGRGHYRRYDERTATMLGDGAELCQRRWGGDLRRLHADGGDDPAALRRLLTVFPGIGPTGADIFLREAQAVWPRLRPYLDRRVIAGAGKLDLPTAPDRLAGLVGDRDLPRFAAALVRISLGSRDAEEVRAVAA
ncbi:hypothetical protein O7632_08085 [Solwaraspora sp. WMMD406]|uniref:hypothetical protein n=1 Tax=Solwaraspora sp. WMMD406 TaxID=3016095 RepID=UPI0024168685|nr:hypothetical protein [Solwaraspora sp. WMMD406]MDG4764063.1 hypothetical protein [Solwaraspora sp. WMMD406]